MNPSKKWSVVLVAILIATSCPTAVLGWARNTDLCKFATSTVRYRFNGVNSTFQSYHTNAVGRWNAHPTGATVVVAGTNPAQIDVYQSTSATGNYGVTQGGCNYGGAWYSNHVSITYYSTYSLSTVQWQGVATHELGRAFGLRHVNTLNCSPTAVPPVAIMHTYATTAVVHCGSSFPWPDDVAGVNSIY